MSDLTRAEEEQANDAMLDRQIEEHYADKREPDIEPDDVCPECQGKLNVVSVTTFEMPHDRWLIVCVDCGHKETRDDLQERENT